MKQIGLILPDDLSSNNEVLKSINKSDPLLLYEPCCNRLHFLSSETLTVSITGLTQIMHSATSVV